MTLYRFVGSSISKLIFINIVISIIPYLIFYMYVQSFSFIYGKKMLEEKKWNANKDEQGEFEKIMGARLGASAKSIVHPLVVVVVVCLIFLLLCLSKERDSRRTEMEDKNDDGQPE